MNSIRRLDWVDAAKGLAIALVVWGHVVARDIRPAGVEWYAAANARLYSFHMAYFFFLAGLVYFVRGSEQPLARWRRTASRLVPAYLLAAGLVFAAKVLAARLLPVDRPVGHLSAELVQQLLYPTQGFASFLWFIVVVLIVQAAAPLLMRLCGQRLELALAVAAGLHAWAVFGDVSEIFGLRQAGRYLLFFMLGALAARHLDTFRQGLVRWRWPLWAGFAALLAFAPMVVLPTAAGLLALGALTALVLALQGTPIFGWLVFLGINSFTIYLLNAICMGLARALVLRSVGWDGALFIPAALLILACGLLVPVAVQRSVFARVPALDRITR